MTDPTSLSREDVDKYVLQLQNTIKHWQERYALARGFMSFDLYLADTTPPTPRLIRDEYTSDFRS